MYTKFENNPSRGFWVIALTPLRAAGGGWRAAGGGRRAAGGGRLRRKTVTSPDPSDTGDIIISFYDKNPFSNYDNQITTNGMLTYYLNDFIVQNVKFVTSKWKPATFNTLYSYSLSPIQKSSCGSATIFYKTDDLRWNMCKKQTKLYARKLFVSA